ncbi:hypothetical protein J22TS1_01680 [Siminovitchia terrae]|uniref:DUF5067 domain-containing protein n=1 Tax=Siminovitchia terrae TaxID=1914933 RepID=UPI001B0755B7|nr:DUF5067 domain-containing protein [Siminovitchia terrae]GIN89117.1 hypothetical protein J22TS1_01680 [Siminovitchia terrae]
MKKIILLLTVTILTFGLAACGGNKSNNSNEGKNTENNSESKEQNESPKQELSDTTMETDEYKFVIKNVEQLKSPLNDSQILALEIEFTNKSDEATDPWMALAVNIRANQETDATVEMLDGANGLYPDDYKTDLVEMGDTDVKSGATVDAIVGFEIKYPGEPVHLVDFDSPDKPEKFEKIVETSKE